MRTAPLAITRAASDGPVHRLQESQLGHAGTVPATARCSIRSSGAAQHARGCSVEPRGDGKVTHDAGAHAQTSGRRQGIRHEYPATPKPGSNNDVRQAPLCGLASRQSRFACVQRISPFKCANEQFTYSRGHILIELYYHPGSFNGYRCAMAAGSRCCTSS